MGERHRREEQGHQARRQQSRHRMTRRGMMSALLAGTGVGLTLPASAGAAVAAGAAGVAMPMPSPQRSSKASPSWRPSFLDDHQNGTLIVLGELIAPGSKKAEINRFIDLLLSVLPADAAQHFATGNSVPMGTVSVPAPARQKLLDALGAFDAEARKRYGSPFKDLAETQQLAILNDASRQPTPVHKSGPERHPPIPQERPVTLYDHFTHLKHWVIGAYYSSEAGIRELGWTGQVIFASYPGCQSSGSSAA